MTPDLVLRDPGHEGGEQQPLDVRRLARHPDRVLVGARVVQADVAADLHRVRDRAGCSRGAGGRRPRRPRRRRRCPSLSPTVHSNTTLLGAFSWSCGAPGWVAFSASTTAGSGSQSTLISSSASSAWAGVSAMTAATPSPVHLTASLARTSGVLTLFVMPDEPPAGQAIGSGLYGMSAPTMTAITPGRRLGRARVDRADVGVRVRAPEDGDVDHPGELDVVEVAALAGDELRVFDPLDRGAEDVCDHVAPPQAVAAGVAPSRMTRAASRTASTMLW